MIVASDTHVLCDQAYDYINNTILMFQIVFTVSLTMSSALQKPLHRGSFLMMLMIQNEELCSCTAISKFDVTDTH